MSFGVKSFQVKSSFNLYYHTMVYEINIQYLRYLQVLLTFKVIRTVNVS